MAEQQLEDYIANTNDDDVVGNGAAQGTETAEDGKNDVVAVNEEDLYRDPNKPVIVGVQMFFSRTGDLDMVHQNFFSQFDLVLEWQPVNVLFVIHCPYHSLHTFETNPLFYQFRPSKRWKSILKIQGISSRIGCQSFNSKMEILQSRPSRSFLEIRGSE